MIRQATEEDIDRILELGQEFGHLMQYQTTKEGLLPHIENIIVNETDGKIDGYFHYHPLLTGIDATFVRNTKVIPEFLVQSAMIRSMTYLLSKKTALAVCMQGASHREVFREFIIYLQERYSELWCWCSVKSHRPETYQELGFSFNPDIRYTFHNPHVDRESIYRLGRWVENG